MPVEVRESNPDGMGHDLALVDRVAHTDGDDRSGAGERLRG